MKKFDKPLLFVWFALSIGTGLIHALSPGTIPFSLRSIAPHWSVGFVMFASIPGEVSVVEYLSTSGKKGNISEVMPTPAYGYANARAQINALRPGYLDHLCTSQHEHTVFVIKTRRAAPFSSPVTRYLDCQGAKKK